MDKAHIETDKELRRLESELKRIYADSMESVINQIKTEYKQLEKYDSKATRKEIKRLKEILRRMTIEVQQVNELATEMLQDELKATIKINDKFAYDQVVKMLEAHNLNPSYHLLDEKAVKAILTGDSFKEIAIDNFLDRNRILTELKRAVSQSLILGEGANKMANRIQKVMSNNHYEAIRIARTETTKAQNTSRNEHYKEALELGIKFKKKWHTAGDNRVRPTHYALEGVEVGPKELFPNGCEYPGVGPANEVIMCRCTFTAELERREKWEKNKDNNNASM